jgi:hypothetical protein
MDTVAKEKVEAASEAVQSPYFMAQEQNDILEQTRTSEHQLIQKDMIKKDQEAPGDDFYELVMIDSVLGKASDELWQNIKDQKAADHILGNSPSEDFVQLEVGSSKEELEEKK